MSPLFKLIIFAVASAGLICLSWSSLRLLRSHGFYRFFAFEAIVGLVLVNVDYWFRRPFGTRQVISWILLSLSIFLLIHGFWLLIQIGKPKLEIVDRSRIGVEKTTELVTIGAYRYIRHPIYSSGIVGICGIFLKHPSLIGLLLSFIAVLFLFLTAKREEQENIRIFGKEYEDYMKRTSMFVPRVF